MPAVSLNQWSGALSEWICAACGFFCDWLTPFLVSRFCSAIFWLPQRLLSEHELAYGARFKLLSVGAGSKHGDLCNEQIRDSNERSNLFFGSLPKPRDKRAPLLPRNSSAD